MRALEYYVMSYGEENTTALLKEKIATVKNANLNAFFQNCLSRLPTYMSTIHGKAGKYETF